MRHESNAPLNVLRGFFVIAAASLGWSLAWTINRPADWFALRNLAGLAIGLALSLATIVVEARAAKGFYPAVFAIVFGLLVGFVSANFFLQGLALLPQFTEIDAKIASAVRAALTTLLCYLTVSLFLKAKDEFMLLVPFVRLTQQDRLRVPRILDASALMDGRVVELLHSKLIEGPIVVPRFVVVEMQKAAESSAKPVRARGRRGLEMLQKIQANGAVQLTIAEEDVSAVETIEQKVVELARRRGAQVITSDHRLKAMAELVGVRVVNMNEVACALKTAVLPGEEIRVELLREGENPGQACGYLDDGTMVIVENSRERIGEELEVEVTSVIQKPQGRLVFGKPRK
ncbi:MAG: TRAM domain-containing protein [Planctomycetes bacterium]|nr:TRAM domain-containing protein [Planctomycetota bacterium]